VKKSPETDIPRHCSNPMLESICYSNSWKAWKQSYGRSTFATSDRSRMKAREW